MKYTVKYTSLFKKSFKKYIKRGYDENLFRAAIGQLAETGTLPAKYKLHKLSGNYSGLWECHLAPDWLLVWEQNDKELILLLMDTGTHTEQLSGREEIQEVQA